MKLLLNVVLLSFVMVIMANDLNGQCKTWIDSPQKDQAEAAHSLYRDVVKSNSADELAALSKENFDHGFNNWKIAYDLAPAADGQRPSHYADGRKFYQALLKKETDEAKKKEYTDMVLRLYDEQMECYKNEKILRGRKAFDMFYSPFYGYREATLEEFKKAIGDSGKDSEYLVLDPMAKLVVYFYQNGKMTKEEARNIYLKLEEVADHNIKNNQRYSQYYEQAKGAMVGEFSKIEDEIFDCAYFKGKLLPEFEKNKTDLEVVKYVYLKLREQGCDSTDVALQELKTTYESLAAGINAQLETERRANNPCYDGTQLQKEGKYAEALARYEECVNAGGLEGEAAAQIYYSMAFIQTWQLGQYGSARQNIRKALDVSPNWGKPYILLGDIYAKMSTGCKEDWDKRLAILAALEKYSYAKSVDGDVADDANKRINNYSGARPDREEGFMRKVNPGDQVTCGCGIGETVTIRFKS